MEWLIEKSLLVCEHGGRVNNKLSQELVKIEGQPVMVATDPEGRSISGCTNGNTLAAQRPCVTTLVVRTGYSEFIAIEGHRVCLSTVRGLTDGTPPGTVDYEVLRPVQTLVEAGS